MSRGGGKKGRSSPGFRGFSASPLGFCRRLRWANVFFPPLRTPRIFRAGGGDGKSSPAPSGGQNGGKKTPKPKNQTKPKPKTKSPLLEGSLGHGGFLHRTCPRPRSAPVFACMQKYPQFHAEPWGLRRVWGLVWVWGLFFGFGFFFTPDGGFLPSALNRLY